MEFTKYPSLENTYRSQVIEKIVAEGLADTQNWVVTEKIHGANFSFWTDGEEVKTASRNQFVDGTFYSCQQVINRYEESVLGLHNVICKPGDVLTVYGELYGEGIQAGVQYGEKDFRFFEVRCNDIPLPAMLFHKSIGNSPVLSLKPVPLLFEGSFEDALMYKETFRSALTPATLEGENNAEGIVIQPEVPLWFRNGKRVILKKKTVAFSEKKNKVTKPTVTMDPEDQSLFELLLQYNTPARVDSVLSKIGEVTTKDFGKLLGLTIQDAIIDCEADHDISVKKGVVGDYKAFMKQINRKFSSTVRETFVKIVA